MLEEQAYNVLVDIIKDVSKKPTQEITKDSYLSSMGIDSIDYVEIVIKMQDTFQISLLEQQIEWHTINTVQSLLQLVFLYSK